MRWESMAFVEPGGGGDTSPDFAQVRSDLGLCLVAHGAGPICNGRAAAELACGVVIDTVEARIGGTSVDATGATLHGALRRANEVLLERGADRSSGAERWSGARASLIALMCRGRSIWICHVGDCRAYRLRGGAMAQLTRDHTLLEELRAARMAEPTPDSPLRRVVTRVLGFRADVQPDLLQEDLQDGDQLLVASPALGWHLETAEIAEVMTRHGGDMAAAGAEVCAMARRGSGAEGEPSARSLAFALGRAVP